MFNEIEVSLNWLKKNKVLLGLDEDNKPIWGSYDEIPTLRFVEKFSYGTYNTVETNIYSSGNNFFVKGDNLYSLKILQDDFKGKIKCIYIDPPFNTGKTFDHYADGLENSIWLSMMKIRLELMKELLSEDGAIMVHIDDDEMPYLKILMDEIFLGQEKNCSNKNNTGNHVATIVWQKKFAPQNDAKFFSDVHDFILIYAKNIKKLRINMIERSEEQNSRYINKDNDPRGLWTSSDLTVKTPNPLWIYPVTLPSGRVVEPSKSRSWGISRDRFDELVNDNRIWFGDNGNSMPRLKRFLADVKKGVVPRTIWLRDEVGDNSEGKKEIKKFININDSVFTTPKPERLLQRIIQLVTNEGDWVLDAFLGSGTTCAVAHKLNRKWIGLENGNQLDDICVFRLKKVIDAKDDGGITKAVHWQGGGGFKYYEMQQ
ncbi:MAG: site-specific DNA-methyltransferase [Anaerolineaceae bacterium]